MVVSTNITYIQSVVAGGCVLAVHHEEIYCYSGATIELNSIAIFLIFDTGPGRLCFLVRNSYWV